MHLQSAEYWGQKGTRARDAVAQLTGHNAKTVMLEMAKHYENLAHRAHMIAVILGAAQNPPEGHSFTQEH
jgi:hypothetical protein